MRDVSIWVYHIILREVVGRAIKYILKSSISPVFKSYIANTEAIGKFSILNDWRISKYMLVPIMASDEFLKIKKTNVGAGAVV